MAVHLNDGMYLELNSSFLPHFQTLLFYTIPFSQSLQLG